MSVKEFWEENPDLFWAYRFSYYTRVREEEEKTNFELWLQGAYFYDALCVALSNSFGKGKQQKYVEKPFSLTQEKQEEEKQKEANKLETQIKNRISQMQAILGKNDEKAQSKGEKVVNTKNE